MQHQIMQIEQQIVSARSELSSVSHERENTMSKISEAESSRYGLEANQSGNRLRTVAIEQQYQMKVSECHQLRCNLSPMTGLLQQAQRDLAQHKELQIRVRNRLAEIDRLLQTYEAEIPSLTALVNRPTPQPRVVGMMTKGLFADEPRYYTRVANQAEISNHARNLTTAHTRMNALNAECSRMRIERSNLTTELQYLDTDLGTKEKTVELRHNEVIQHERKIAAAEKLLEQKKVELDRSKQEGDDLTKQFADNKLNVYRLYVLLQQHQRATDRINQHISQFERQLAQLRQQADRLPEPEQSLEELAKQELMQEGYHESADPSPSQVSGITDDVLHQIAMQEIEMENVREGITRAAEAAVVNGAGFFGGLSAGAKKRIKAIRRLGRNNVKQVESQLDEFSKDWNRSIK